MRIALPLAALLFVAPLSAQTTPSEIQATQPAPSTVTSTPPAAKPAATTPAVPVPLAPPGPGIVRVRLTTSRGPILIDLDAAKAPLTVANFLKYVDTRRFDGMSIYRIVKAAPGYGFIQGGINNDPKRMLPPVAHEPTSKTGLSHTDGAISLPRSAPGSGRGEFFIVVGDLSSMDADPKQPGDNLGYAVFGHVVQGMEIVRPMIDDPVSPTKMFAGMKGQVPEAPVRIVSVRRATN